MSGSYNNGYARLSQISELQKQIDDIETGQTTIDYTLPYYVNQGSTILDPKTNLYNGTQGFITNNNVDENANISGDKLANSSIPNSKLITVDGSRLVDLSITDSKISSMSSSKLIGSLPQSQIENLTTDLVSINSKFPLTDSNVSTTANIQQSKIQNLTTNLSTINSQIAALQVSTMTNVTYINQGTSNTIDAFINAATSGTCFQLSPSASGFALTNPAVITTSNNAISLTGFAKSYLSNANTTNIIGAGSFTLKALNLQYYFCNINLTCTSFVVQGGNSATPSTLAFASENCNINAPLIIQNSAGFMNFVSTAFAGNITISNTTLCNAIYFTNCNMANRVIVNNSSTPLIFQNCINLNSLSISNAIFSGFITLNSGVSYNFVTSPLPKNPITQQDYKWLANDLAMNCNILGTQLSSSAGIVSGQISSLNTDKLVVNSGLTMGTNLITCTASNVNIGSSSTNLITKSYADATYTSGSGFATLTGTQTFTGVNTFSNSMIITAPTTSLNPITLKYFSDYTFTKNLLFGNSAFTWFDFSESSLARTFFRSSDGQIVVRSFGNCVNSNYPFRLSTDQATNRMPGLVTSTFNNINRTHLRFLGPNNVGGFGEPLSCPQDLGTSGGPGNEMVLFVVFKPTLLITNTIVSSDGIGGGWGRSLLFSSASGRNTFTTINVSLSANTGTLNGTTSNGTYKMTYGGTGLQSDEILLSTLVNKMCIVCLSYTSGATTIGDTNLRRTVCMNSWLTCNTVEVGFDMKVSQNDISCYGQTEDETEWVLGARSPGSEVIPTSPFAGDIHEIIMYGTRQLTNEQRILTTNYLYSKWLA